MADRAPGHDSVETARERETFRYDTSLIATTVYNNTANLIPPSDLRTCSDPALTSFAQLAALRLGASRALISLFDRKFQYIVAEATQTSTSLPNASTADDVDPQELWLCGTAIPRAFGLCEDVLVASHPQPAESSALHGPPLTVIPDLALDPRSCDKPILKCWPRPRFYAGVPLQSRRGINIGVFCVYGDDPRQGLDLLSTRFMQTLSTTVVSHLDARRTGERHRRAVRMVRGMGSFVEGRTTMSAWRLGPNADSFDDDPSLEGALNLNQQHLDEEADEAAAAAAAQEERETNITPAQNDKSPGSPLRSVRHQSSPPVIMGDRREPLGSNPSIHSVSSISTAHQSHHDSHETEISHVFSKAANIIREAIEVEGVCFLDASIGSFAGLATTSHTAKTGSSPSSSSSDETEGRGTRQDSPLRCRSLGHSNSLTSSIDRQAGRLPDTVEFSERFLSRLLRRYPEGKIFAFDENGSLQSTDVSEEDTVKSPSTSHRPLSPPTLPKTSTNQTKRRVTRENEAKSILSLFPGARSVALVPIWDSQKHRWYAGCLVYTNNPTRILAKESELSYLRAFGAVIMAEVNRINAGLVDKAKSDLLSSLSHELRSPLHGIILGAELLHDTALDAFQGDVLHSVETCGHTLLDTMDHLLDWSKINNFLRTSPDRRNSVSSSGDRGLRNADQRISIESGMMSLTSNVEIDVLAEEVIEAVCAGFSFQRVAVSHAGDTRPSEHADSAALHRLHSMQAMETMATNRSRSGDIQLVLGDVAVTFDINPATSWAFHTQAGALRRIIMNVLGNALKYTNKGFVNVNVVQMEPSGNQRSDSRIIQIVVADSGKGMSEEYLNHHLFAPFYQEDTLSAGTGLGLSIVKEVVNRLGGSIKVESKLGSGTRVTVRLSLATAVPTTPRRAISKAVNFDDFKAQVNELKGLRARLLGFPTHYGVLPDSELSDKMLSEGAVISNICREWLEMEIIDQPGQEELLPDLVLSTERNLDRIWYERSRGLVSTPVVVVCRNALVARQLATSPRYTSKKVVFEFISQPIGPRKLARVLLLSFRRWTKLQASVIPTPTALSLASAEQSTTAETSDATSAREPDANMPAPSTETIAETDRSEYFDAQDAQDAQTASHDQSPGKTPTADTVDTPRKVALSHRTLKSLEPIPSKPPRKPKVDKSVSSLFLLVDDNQINLRILESYMKKLGHEYMTAMDGKQALDTFKTSEVKIAAVFMDISMPVMDGFEATRQIRVFEAQNSLPRCQIFALTGLASASAQEEAFASGIDLFLTKPVKLKELSRILEQHNLA